MVTYENVNLTTDLKKQLEDIAKEKQTDIDNTIKLLLLENKELKNPSYLTTTKISKNKSTFSTVIPAPIKNKFNLSKGQVLYWDIEDNKIIITPETITDDLPETPSINAMGDILQDFIFNGNTNYFKVSQDIFLELNSSEDEDTKINNIITNYNGGNKEEYKKVISYLLDYPLEPEKRAILKEVHNKINKLDNSSK